MAVRRGISDYTVKNINNFTVVSWQILHVITFNLACNNLPVNS